MSDAADARCNDILETHGQTLMDLIREAKLITQNVNLSKKSKRHHLTRVATEFSDFIKPLTACKNNCSHCCNMATAVSQEEAELIGEHIGRKPEVVIFDMEEFYRREGYRDIYTGVPCTFLADDGQCTIYEVRPIACRLHHSLEDSPDLCKMGVKQDVGVLNIYAIHNAYIDNTRVMSQGGAIGDIRQFFPPEPGRIINPASVVTKEEV